MPVFSCRFLVCGRLYKLKFVGTLRDGASFSSLTIVIEIILHLPSNFLLNVFTTAGN